MAKLLVSVRDVEEADRAFRGGADVIDLKEPRRGALGATEADVWTTVVQRIGAARPISVALGELVDALDPSQRDWRGISFAKLGLSSAGKLSNWTTVGREALQRLPEHVVRVAVAYADWRSCAAPCPADVLTWAADAGCRVLLIDTFDKRGGHLFHYVCVSELQRLIAAAQRRGMRIALAGSLSAVAFLEACRLRPDWVAVRGAACRGCRDSSIDETRVRELALQVRAEHAA